MFGVDGLALIILLFFLLFYFAPAIVATQRNHSKATAIRILNLLAGWTFIGWVAAAVWAYTEDNRVIKGGANKNGDFLDSKKCPKCAEIIKLEAKVCKHCGNEFTVDEIKEIQKELQNRKTSKCELCGSIFPSADIEIIEGKAACPSCFKANGS
jgi:alpha/beta superfamily hydrolase